METLLTILVVLGLGAIAVSIYVFSVAARDFVSEESHDPANHPPGGRERVQRSGLERRSGVVVQFPLVLDRGVLIAEDRRVQPERRQTA